MNVITRELPSDYFTANRFKDGDQLNLKYINATDRRGNEIFLIWGPCLESLHKDKMKRFGFSSVISAGYIGYEPELGFYCWGESMSLSVKARKVEDTEILQNWIKECSAETA